MSARLKREMRAQLKAEAASRAYVSPPREWSPTHERGSGAYVWYVIGLLAVVNVFNYMDRIALSVLAPSIKADLKLTDGQLGMLIGFAFSLFYAVCGIPIARWADRSSRRSIIAITLTTWSVMTALCGLAQSFWQLFAARVGVGVGEAGCIPAGQALICDYVPPRRRSGFYAIHTFGVVVGMMLGMALAGFLAEAIGWRLTFVVLGLPGIVLAVIVRLTLREPQRGFFDAQLDDPLPMPFVRTMKSLLKVKVYALLVLFFVANGFVNFGLTQWWPSLFARVFGVRLSTVGVYLGIAIGAGEGVGLLIGGLLANRAARHDLERPLIVGAAAIVLAIPVAVGSLFASSVMISAVLVAVTAFLWGICQGPALAAMYGAVKPRMRATAGALTLFFVSVLGLGLGPFCVGVLSDVLAPSLAAESLRYALLAPICLLPLMAYSLWLAARALRSDQEPATVTNSKG